ncbi:hypothetical protein FKR81_19710 [Lentzea tibetensis]|uniref:Uncharacterized protein n=1 Tax=Lentzea tibetensis TaxID=2591470 RepID=A0A563ERX5_9PSEU|nr:hypothetical protein [Lentzea tibetensis]TWP50409.1 hypothetical protein FKR81_19710 [Lentzea tibetensis]
MQMSYSQRIMGVTAALAAVLGTAIPASAAADTTPVGTWDGIVTVADAPAQHATLSFAASGKACVTFGSGESASTGVGTWSATDADHFSFEVVRGALDPAGNPITVKASQQAGQESDNFTSSGVSEIFASDGTPLGSWPSKASATRTSASDPADCV